MRLINMLRSLSIKKNLLKRVSKSSQATIWGSERIEQRPRHYHAYAQEGYSHNPIVYRAITLIARSIASVPWVVLESGHRMNAHPLLCLINRPNPLRGGSTFIEHVVSYLLLSGNSYVQVVSRDEGLPLELHALRPDHVQIRLDHQGQLIGYHCQAPERDRALWFPYTAEPSECSILHLRMFHPLQDTYGLSPLEAASLSTDQHNAVAQHNLSLLEHGGRPTGALMVKSGNHHGSSFQLTSEQRQALKDQVHETFSGSGNAGKILVLEGNMEWKEMGVSLKDLDYISGKNLSAREIAQVFGIPPMLVGVPGDSTFANYREARLHFWEDTVLPLLENLTCELNRWITPRYGAKLQLSYDTDAIPALSPKREIVWSKIARTDFLTVNEKRQAIGYPPLPEGDHL